MSFDVSYKTIYSTLDSGWAWPYQLTYEEDDSMRMRADGQPYARVSVREGGGEQADMAGDQSRVRMDGIIFIDCFMVRGQGTSIARQMADSIVPILEGQNLAGGIHVLTRQSGPAGPVDDKWWRQQVYFPYWRFETIRTADGP